MKLKAPARVGRWLIGGICLFFLVYKLSTLRLESVVLDPVHLCLAIGLVLLFMPLNWLLEAERWRVSLQGEHLSSREALRIVLAGQALNWGIPFSLGDAAARISAATQKWQSVSAVLLNRTVMLLITGLLGFISLYYFFQFSTHWLVIGVFVLSIAGYIGFQFIVKSGFAERMVLQVILLSLIRYAVFFFQFHVLIRFFNPELGSLVIIHGICWIFLFRSFIPALFGNFGVREAGALLFFEGLVANPSQILLPCLLIWLINLVIPSIYGFWAFMRPNLSAS